MVEERMTLTHSGYHKLEDELALLQQQLKEVIEELGDSHDDEGVGDSAQYSLATERERLQERVNYLKHVLNTAIIIDFAPTDTVSVGNRVTLEDSEGESFTFDLISQAEIFAGQRGVSNESPVGRAVLGHKVGDTVKAETPDGTVKYTIKAIDVIPE